jgi:hypothetical protein
MLCHTLRRLVIFIAAALLPATLAAQIAPATPAKKPATSSPAKKAAAGTTPKAAMPSGPVGPNTPVMFVSGLCSIPTGPTAPVVIVQRPGEPASACTRGVTKSQFESMVQALGPRAAQADKAQLAEYYVRALLIDNQTRKMKLDQDQKVAEAIWMGRVAALGEALHQHFQKQFANIPQNEVQAYYNAHKAEFEEATIRRIVVPKPQQKANVVKPTDAKPADTKPEAQKPGAPDTPSAAKPATTPAEVPYEQQVTARKAYTEKLLERAKAGEPFDKLQKEAFAAANIQSAAPETEAVPIRRGQIPPAHDEKVFALQPGQYTPIIDEPAAYVFYKVESRRTVPLADVSEDIKAAIRNQKEDDIIKQVFTAGKPVLNPQYFAPPSRPRSGAAPEGAEEQPSAPQPQQQPEGGKQQEAAPPSAPSQAQPPAATPNQPAAQPQTPPEPPKQESSGEAPK